MRPPKPRVGLKEVSDPPPPPSHKYNVGLIRSGSSVSKLETKRAIPLPDSLLWTPTIENVLQSRHVSAIGGTLNRSGSRAESQQSSSASNSTNGMLIQPKQRDRSHPPGFTATMMPGDLIKQTRHFHHGSSSSSPAQKIAFCNICLASLPFSKFSPIEGCKHNYCSRCLGSYIESKINANVTKIKCPDAACKDGKLEPLACKSMIPKKAFDRWCDALCESTVGEKFYCPFKDCSALLMDERGQEVMEESECPHCHRLFCAHCRVPWHAGLNCRKFQEMSQLGDEKKQDSLLLELAKKSRWQRCPRCKFYVEKVSGCMFIKCRCGATFCYGCASAMEVDHYCSKCKR